MPRCPTTPRAATTSATFTTVTTVTLNSKITEGIANAINNTAGISDVVEAYDYQNGTIDIRGKAAGTAITITRTLGGSANASPNKACLYFGGSPAQTTTEEFSSVGTVAVD